MFSRTSIKKPRRKSVNDLKQQRAIVAEPIESFQKALEHRTGRKLKLRINDNHSTMLSVRWEPDHTRVSVHRMFLDAPHNVMDDLACYLRGKKRELAPTVKAFIEQCRKGLDYSHAIDHRELYHEGEVYNVFDLYNEVNAEYFSNKLDLLITWFGQPTCRNRTRISFGLYQDTLRLIKINRILDKNEVPCYLVKYVIYHEMLHHVYPPYLDESGVQRIHNEEFKQQEQKFRYYHRATHWIRENRENLFAGTI